MLFLNSSADLFGSERALFDLVRGLNGCGHESLVVFPERGPAVELFTGAGIPVEVVPFPVLRRSQGRRIPMDIVGALGSAPSGVVRLAREFGATVVYSNTSHVLAGPAVARTVGVPHVWHVREIERVSTGARQAWGRLLHRTGTVIAISRAVAVNLFSARTLRRKLDRSIFVVHDGIDVGAFHYRARFVGDRRTAVIVLPGRITPWKGQELAIDAMTNIASSVRLDIVGDVTTSKDKAFLDEVVRRRSNALANVRLVGLVGNPSDVYADAQFLLQSSLAQEPFGRTVVEAMASGVVPIVSDRGGPAEVVRDGVDGFVYRFGDSESLARTIDRAAGSATETLGELALVARRRVVECFTAERNAQMVADRVLSGRFA